VTTGRYSFRNLELWKDAQEFAVRACRIADALPDKRSADVIGRQLTRAATAIAANIAEGHARYSLAAHRNHLSIAKGSTAEAEHWIDLLMRLQFIDADLGSALERSCIRLTGVLTRRIADPERQEERRRVRDQGSQYTGEPQLVPWFNGSMVEGAAEGGGP